jgi:hypothetical protein
MSEFARLKPLRVIRASIYFRRGSNPPAFALPLILTFFPAAKNAAEAKEQPVHGRQKRRQHCWQLAFFAVKRQAVGGMHLS